MWLVVYRKSLTISNYLKKKKKKEQGGRNGDVDEAQPITRPNHIK